MTRKEIGGEMPKLGVLFFVGAVTLAGCQANQTNSPPAGGAAPALKNHISAAVAASAPGWDAEFESSYLFSGNAPMTWEFCLRKPKQGEVWAIEGAGTCPLSDGGHERILVDLAARKVQAYVSIVPLNEQFQKGDDAKLQRRYYCREQVIGADDLQATHNVCVSSFSTTYIDAAGAVGGLISAPLWAAGGKRSYYVEVDRDAILAAAVSSGAIQESFSKARSALEAAITTGIRSAQLTSLRSAAARLLADDPGLKERLDAKIKELRVAEAEQQQKDADAARIAAEQKRIAQEQAASALRQQEAKLAAQQAVERQKEIAKDHLLTMAFRKTLKVGDQTHCGIVLSINGPVSIVQAPSPIGQYGLKINQLYPDGLAPCNFFNGSYQDPQLPY